MAELLIQGSRGEEVRRLQRNLNAALANRKVILAGRNVIPLNPDGDFGRCTKAAVEAFQRDYKLKKVDGKVGPETRNALATRTLVITGTVSQNSKPAPPTLTPTPAPAPPASNPKPGPPPATNWLFQVQPAVGLTPPPFVPSSSGGASILTAQVALGLVYRTASEGPHWEFGGAFQPAINVKNSPTDPRYTLQLQGSATFADPYSKGRFHTALFGQVLLVTNLAPASLGAGVQVGGQISVDVIEDRWSLFSQAGLQLAGQWALSGPSAGQFQFGPVFTILGSTVQWDIK